MLGEKHIPFPQLEQTTADTDPVLRRVVAGMRQIGLENCTPERIAAIRQEVEESPIGRRASFRVVR